MSTSMPCEVRTCPAQQPGQALRPDPIPVIETEADIAGGESGQARVLLQPKLPGLEQRRQRPAASVDLHPIRALGQRHEHSMRRPPDIAALSQFRVLRDRGNEKDGHAEARIQEADAGGHARSSLSVMVSVCGTRQLHWSRLPTVTLRAIT